MQKKTCALCDNANDVADLYGYPVCETCRSKIGLLKVKTIQNHIASFEKARKKSSSKPTYEEEILGRLEFLEKDYIRKKIKLLHVKNRLEGIEKN